MSSNLPSENLTSADRIALRNIQQKAWFTLLRTYGVFFLALIFLYWRMYPGSTFRGARMRMSVGEYRILYWCITTVFGSIFALFCYRDYKRLIAPLRKDLALGQCQNRSFYARKYADPVYDK